MKCDKLFTVNTTEHDPIYMENVLSVGILWLLGQMIHIPKYQVVIAPLRRRCACWMWLCWGSSRCVPRPLPTDVWNKISHERMAWCHEPFVSFISCFVLSVSSFFFQSKLMWVLIRNWFRFWTVTANCIHFLLGILSWDLFFPHGWRQYQKRRSEHFLKPTLSNSHHQNNGS